MLAYLSVKSFLRHVCASAVCLSLFAGGASAAEPLSFNRDIRPILSDACFKCHGPDKNTREAELRLDDAESALADRDGHRVLVPGDLAQSELVKRITSDDESVQMPPPDSGKKLSAQQIALLKTWVQQGAKFEKHWSQIPPQKYDPPPVKNAKWPLNPIDRFVLARIEQAGLKPSPPADRRTLLRRLSFDLIGLPPTPEEVAAFENDKSPDAYAKAVDRLLANPHYGERMAVYWLDLVRYADSIGYHSDNPRDVWMYRDWVIAAFNDNLPYDRFTVEQLAGDLLPNATTQQKIASGYNRLLQTTEEGGAQPKEYMAKYAADRVRNLGEVWLAATTGCSECHDHKFDPYTMKDFYSLAAFFADIQERAVGRRQATPIPTREFEAKLKAVDQKLAAAQARLNAGGPEFQAALAKWEQSLSEDLKRQPPKLSDWHSIGPFRAGSFNEAHQKRFPPEEKIDLAASYGKLKWKKQPKWKDGTPHNLKGDNSATYLYRTITAAAASPLELSLGSDDSIRVWLNGEEVLNKKVQRGVAPDQEKVTVAIQPGENKLLMKITNGGGGYGFYFRVASAGLPAEIVNILKTPAAERKGAQQKKLADYYRGIAPELKPVREQIAKLEQEKKALNDAMPKMLVTTSGNPRTMRILPRGNWLDDSGQVVQPDVPDFLGDLNTDGRATRLDLARWLVRPENPMVARAFVNRLWKLYLGYGIARTLDDMGAQGEWPTHPLLLDWLAVEFIESGWDVKHMVRLIVTSQAYRQSSQASAALRERDPYNKLFARQTRFRIDAEFVRDNALAISGLLEEKIGGPSVKPYQPAGYWQHLNFPRRKWQPGTGEDLYRRGLYTHWQRSFLHPSLLAFDAPTREECTAERARSNTPQQALVLLNDPTYVEAARTFAARIVQKGGSDFAARLDWAFQQALQRKPREQEIKLLTQLHQQHLQQYQQEPDAAKALTQVGAAPPAQEADVAELAAYTSVARVILNLHETIMRY